MGHTKLGQFDVDNEIDRYIMMPGQALAYMTGKLRLLGIRARLKNALGERFSLSTFHDAVLGAGPLPLDLLEQNVDRLLLPTLPNRAEAAR